MLQNLKTQIMNERRDEDFFLMRGRSGTWGQNGQNLENVPLLWFHSRLICASSPPPILHSSFPNLLLLSLFLSSSFAPYSGGEAIEPLPGQMTYIELGGGRPDSGQNVTETPRTPPANPAQKLLGDLPFTVTLFSGADSRNEE